MTERKADGIGFRQGAKKNGIAQTVHRGRKGILKYFGFWDFLASDYAIVPN